MKTKVLKLLTLIGGFILVSIISYFILKHFGFTEKEKIEEVVNSAGFFGIVVFLILQVVLTIATSMIPGTSMLFILISSALYGSLLGGVISLIGVYLASVVLFLIGKSFGGVAVNKIIGEEEIKRAQDLIDVKTKIYLPVIFVLPFFPDDAACVVAGLTKIKFKEFFIIVVIFRALGVFATSYSYEILKLLNYNSWGVLEYIIASILIVILFYSATKLMSYIENKIKEKKKEEK